MNLTDLAHEIHEDNHKWWHDLDTGERLDRNLGEMCMLIISELSEAMEGARKDLMDNHLPHRKMEEVELADAVIRVLDLAGAYEIPIHPVEVRPWRNSDNIGESLFQIVSMVVDMEFMFQHDDDREKWGNLYLDDLLWTIEDYSKWRGFDLWGAVEEKRAYNKTRHDHSVEGRKAAGGKKW